LVGLIMESYRMVILIAKEEENKLGLSCAKLGRS
jgi:hypothetical protein